MVGELPEPDAVPSDLPDAEAAGPDEREAWRSVSVVRDLVIACVSGQGVEGYREALVRLSKELDG